mmetsp:Transcript_122445/g.261265  ORF Transcript_122445/g.261265 Transcript_122445/m.261265 type:complete len:252 (-) Transcript_122445:42-797(-)
MRRCGVIWRLHLLLGCQLPWQVAAACSARARLPWRARRGRPLRGRRGGVGAAGSWTQLLLHVAHPRAMHWAQSHLREKGCTGSAGAGGAAEVGAWYPPGAGRRRLVLAELLQHKDARVRRLLTEHILGEPLNVLQQPVTLVAVLLGDLVLPVSARTAARLRPRTSATADSEHDLRGQAVLQSHGDAADGLLVNLLWQMLACELLEEPHLHGSLLGAGMRHQQRSVDLQLSLLAGGAHAHREHRPLRRVPRL